MSLRVKKRDVLAGIGGVGLWAVTSVAGCDTDTTTGSRVDYRITVASDVGRGTPFDNDFGWSIRLDEAILALDSLVFVDGDPIARRWRRWLLREAHAHPGHFAEGRVLAEMLSPVDIDLLAPATELATVAGVTGMIRSGGLVFRDTSPPADASSSRRGATGAIRVAGAAVRGGDEVAFDAVATADDLRDPASGAPELRGCPVHDGDATEGGGTLALEVSVATWLARVPFEELSRDGASLVPGRAPHNAFVRGTRKAIAYTATFRRS